MKLPKPILKLYSLKPSNFFHILILFVIFIVITNSEGGGNLIDFYLPFLIKLFIYELRKF